MKQFKNISNSVVESIYAINVNFFDAKWYEQDAMYTGMSRAGS